MARHFILDVRKASYSPKAQYLVHVPKSLYAAGGAQRRFFEKEAIAKAYRKASGSVGFSRRKFRDAYSKAGFAEWPLDVLRHSFGTYRLPIMKAAESLAMEMGNSPVVIFRHYRRAMNEATALAYQHNTAGSPPATLRIAANDDP